MEMPDRTQSSGGYRYGFNGKENDNEWGDVSSYDYGFRIYNPGLGRFLSVDPLARNYPWYTPYQFAGNKPIVAIDIDGLEEYFKYLESTIHNDNDSKVTTAWKITKNVTKGLFNVIPYIGNVGNSVINEGIMGPVNMVNNDLDKLSYVIAEDMIESVQKNEFNSGAEYLLNRVQKPEVIENILTGVATRKVFKPIKAQLTSILVKRSNLAKAFLSKAGATDIDRHIKAINFDKPVYTSTLEAGTKIYRYSEIGTKNPKHYFFSDKNLATPGEVGKMSIYKNPAKFTLEEFTLNKATKVLNSTVDLDGNPGAKQIFSTELQGNSTITRTNLTLDKID